MSEFTGHVTVLRDELVSLTTENCDPNEKLLFADLTFGGGGHTFYLLEKFPNASVIAFDQDSDAIRNGLKSIESKGFSNCIQLIQSNFAEFGKVCSDQTFDAIIADLGVSSHHLDSAERGFSFRADGPLDMRMDQEQNELTAATVINEFSAKDLVEIFEKYGEEKFAKRIVENIIDERRKNLITTTKELENIVFHSYPRSLRLNRRKHPATQVFQALRIFVNGELESVEKVIPDCLNRLKSGGRMGIITFHSLEDRIVKNQFKEAAMKSHFSLVNKKPIEARESEIIHNNRARSAKLRVVEKVLKDET